MNEHRQNADHDTSEASPQTKDRGAATACPPKLEERWWEADNAMRSQRILKFEDAAMLAEDARTLMAATADVAEDGVAEARSRLAAALERSKEIRDSARDKAVEAAKATDAAVRDHPYQAIGIAFGVGALLGYLISRRDPRHGD